MNASSLLSPPLEDPRYHPARSFLPNLHHLDLSCQSEAMAGGRRGTYAAMVTTNQRALSQILPYQVSGDLPVVNAKVSKAMLLFMFGYSQCLYFLISQFT